MKIQTEQGRTVISAQKELDLGVEEVKALIESWAQEIREDRECFPRVEKEIHSQMRLLGDQITAGLLAEVCAEGPSEEKIEAIREQAKAEGNPLRAAMRSYPITVMLLGGMMFLFRVAYCPSDKRRRDDLIENGVVPEDANYRGVHVELSELGFGKSCSAGLQEEVARLVSILPSLEMVRQELKRRGISMNIKQIRRIAQEMGKGMLDVRRERIFQWKAGELLIGEELEGKRVGVAIDGGRVRLRDNTKGKKSRRFEPHWREPKVIIIYILDDEGKKEAKTACWIDATFQKADHAMELLAMHLHRLGAKHAKTIEFVSDGAPWIWNRLGWVIDQVGIDHEKVVKVLDFWHAAHHISITLEGLGLEGEARAKMYRELRRDLRQGRWKHVVEELTKLAVSLDLPKDHSVYKEIDYLRRHGEGGRLRYLKCKQMRITRGSGAIESCIRRLINLKMKGNGIFWTEENAESVMLMRANILSGQWDKEVAETRKRWKTGGGKRYRWEAENILKYVKPEYPEEAEMLQLPEISTKSSKVA